jgi:vacuolar-type H+-ATPase subunit I/STV1
MDEATKEERWAYDLGYKDGKQAGREEQLAKMFIVDSHPKKEDCCVICGKKPDIIIHADCAFDKGVVSKRMNEKNERIASLEKEKKELRDALERIAKNRRNQEDAIGQLMCACEENEEIAKSALKGTEG